MKATHHTAPGQVRIMAGQYKRTPLTVLSLPGLRPTPSRVRETLFNWLGPDLTGWCCVDAFAGTGALGFEAASRGAARVSLCEQNVQQVAQLQATQTKLKANSVSVEQGDGLLCLRRLASASVQLIFLDPPFNTSLLEQALPLAAQAIATPGYIYLESPHAWTEADVSPWALQIYRYAQAGAVHFGLLKK